MVCRRNGVLRATGCYALQAFESGSNATIIAHVLSYVQPDVDPVKSGKAHEARASAGASVRTNSMSVLNPPFTSPPTHPQPLAYTHTRTHHNKANTALRPLHAKQHIK